MKFSYYGYHFHNKGTNQRFIQSLEPILSVFTQINNPIFKNEFIHNGEHLYLVRSSANLYIFAQTKNNELIRKINESNISISQISELLEVDESIGFASYISIKENHLAIASTLQAPKISTFCTFVNQIIHKAGIGNIDFIASPFQSSKSREEILQLEFIGKSTLQVTKENNLAGHIMAFIGGNPEDFIDVDSFEVTIVPKRRHNIKPTVHRMLDRAGENGVDKVAFRAKEELQDRITDYYLYSSSNISDTIDSDNDAELAVKINEKMADNHILEEKVAEHEQNDAFTKEVDNILSSLSSVRNWPDRITNPPNPD